MTPPHQHVGVGVINFMFILVVREAKTEYTFFMDFPEFPLISRRSIAEGTMEFTFCAEQSGMTFLAGQHADYININQPVMDAEGNGRAFSFSSAPRKDGTFTVAMRLRNTAFKNWWRDMPLGTKVKFDGPRGDMVLPEDIRPVVFLSGGIGITPFHSMIEDVKNRKSSFPITLFFSNRRQVDAPYYDDLVAWAKEVPSFTFVPTWTAEAPEGWDGERGYINADMIKRHVPNLVTPLFYLAGPTPMIQAMRKVLDSLGVKRDRIRQEEFTGY